MLEYDFGETEQLMHEGMNELEGNGTDWNGTKQEGRKKMGK